LIQTFLLFFTVGWARFLLLFHEPIPPPLFSVSLSSKIFDLPPSSVDTISFLVYLKSKGHYFVRKSLLHRSWISNTTGETP